MRRTTLAGLAGLTLAVALIALALLVGGAAGGHGKGKGHSNSNASSTHGRIGFHFLVLNQVVGTSDRVIIQGDGSFNRNQASGGGTFDRFTACPMGTVCPLVATGTWKALLRINTESRKKSFEALVGGESSNEVVNDKCNRIVTAETCIQRFLFLTSRRLRAHGDQPAVRVDGLQPDEGAQALGRSSVGSCERRDEPSPRRSFFEPALAPPGRECGLAD